MENQNELSGMSGQPDLLAEESFGLDQYVYATQGQRFLNWLIDNLLMRYGLSYLTGMGIGLIIGIANPDLFEDIASSSERGPMLMFGVIIAYLNYIFYYTICEKLFRGYTIGKLITGTRAIRQDGKELTFKNAILRSLCRLVPFEVFSGFNTLTWHDSWTDTMVIRSR